MNSESIFRYSYSAKQNEEVLVIRNKYLPREETRLEELKRLDYEVSSAGLPQSLAVGIVGCLVFGLGMCIAMEVLRGGVVLGTLIGTCVTLGAVAIAASVVVGSNVGKLVSAGLKGAKSAVEEELTKLKTGASSKEENTTFADAEETAAEKVEASPANFEN